MRQQLKSLSKERIIERINKTIGSNKVSNLLPTFRVSPRDHFFNCIRNQTYVSCERIIISNYAHYFIVHPVLAFLGSIKNIWIFPVFSNQSIQ